MLIHFQTIFNNSSLKKVIYNNPLAFLQDISNAESTADSTFQIEEVVAESEDEEFDVGSFVGLEIDGEDYYGTIIEFDDDEGTVVIEEDETGDEIVGYQDEMFIPEE